MIVISRRKNEALMINDDITIVVVEIRGDKVRLGVELPREVSLHRGEVYDAIRRNQEPQEITAPTEPEDAIRDRIAELHRQITELEARL
jgi:carbon storage regulator